LKCNREGWDLRDPGLETGEWPKGRKRVTAGSKSWGERREGGEGLTGGGA